MPTVRLRRLAADMRRLREQASLSREDVEARTGINAATLYRLETARVQRPQRRTLVALLDVYGVEDQHRKELLDLARDSTRLGAQIFEGAVSDEFNSYLNFEAEARAIANYEALLVPGLLQTERYAYFIVRNIDRELPEQVVERRVAVRMRRQALLHKDEPLRLWAIMDEAAIRRMVGGPIVMGEQLRHLVKMAQEPRITIQIVPFEVGVHTGMDGPFVILEFADPADRPLVFLDSAVGEMYLESDDDVIHYRLLFDHLRAAALNTEQSSRLLESAANDQDGA